MVRHDRSEILGHDYVLVTVKVVYDPAVFKSESDVDQRTAQSIPDLQAYIEEPEIHVLAMNSSSIEDQAALISDRMECIRELNTDLKAADNIAISDKLLFFLLVTNLRHNSNVEPKSVATIHVDRAEHMLHNLMTSHIVRTTNGDHFKLYSPPSSKVWVVHIWYILYG